MASYIGCTVLSTYFSCNLSKMVLSSFGELVPPRVIGVRQPRFVWPSKIFLTFQNNPHEFKRSSLRQKPAKTTLYECVRARAQHREETEMLLKSWFVEQSRLQIASLRGGHLHRFYYFVGISQSPESESFTEIMRLRLLNQMGSQRSAAFPQGYELFQGLLGQAKLCLSTMMIPVPRLKIVESGWPKRGLAPRIVTERRPASVLRSGKDQSHEFRWLKKFSAAPRLRQRIREHAVQSLEKFETVLGILSYDGAPDCPDQADRFEALLAAADLAYLENLARLLELPEPVSLPSGPALARAA